MAEITGAQSLIQSLESAGVDTVFGIPGATILSAASLTRFEFGLVVG